MQLIKDMNGFMIEIVDLPGAIEQAAGFKERRDVDEPYWHIEDLVRKYWRDMHSRLLALQEELNTPTHYEPPKTH